MSTLTRAALVTAAAMAGIVGVARGQSPPNLVYILIDDLGFNDLGFGNGSYARTPAIDSLAEDGMRLSRFYVQSFCTPTRAAFMTGRYPGRYGLQTGVLAEEAPVGLSLNETLLTDELKRANYSNYLIGKWHLGFFKEECTPLERNFDKFVGHYGSGIGKWDSVHKGGSDFHNNSLACEPLAGNEYVEEVYLTAMEDTLEDHNANKPDEPFFLFMSHSNPHTPAEATTDSLQRYSDLIGTINVNRRTYLAMVTKVDDVVNATVNKLKELDMWDNTLIVLSSDNGGATYDVESSNYPLRGAKTSLWEGGVRSQALIAGGYLHNWNRGKVYDGLMHVSDVFATFVSVAGLTPTATEIDGIDHSTVIENRHTSQTDPRTEVILNIDWEHERCNHTLKGVKLCGGIIRGDHKMVIGHAIEVATKTRSGWTNEWTGANEEHALVQCGAGNTHEDPPAWAQSARKSCPWTSNGTTQPCVYDLSEDPCEYTDIADTFNATEPDTFDDMIDTLLAYKAKFVPAVNLQVSADNASHPTNFQPRCWTPWL